MLKTPTRCEEYYIYNTDNFGVKECNALIRLSPSTGRSTTSTDYTDAKSPLEVNNRISFYFFLSKDRSSFWLWLTSGTMISVAEGVGFCSPLITPERRSEPVESFGADNLCSRTRELGSGQPGPGHGCPETPLTLTVKIVAISANKSNASNTFMVVPPVRFELRI